MKTILTAAAVVFLAGPAFAQDASIAASPQPAGNSVTIDKVTMPADGWLVIHEIKDGKPQAPQSIGHAPVKAGENANITVTLDMDVAPGSKVLAMLHEDTGTIGTYEFGPGSTDNDKPVMADGKPVVLPVAIE
ncbi:DUF7282 domain-containing protein [Roseibium sp.]|uniref:DUF7282 domain-containing protein n=1 Tax=Roseibium sp. TaxID=1936156 RepID=UPI003D10A899